MQPLVVINLNVVQFTLKVITNPWHGTTKLRILRKGLLIAWFLAKAASLHKLIPNGLKLVGKPLMLSGFPKATISSVNGIRKTTANNIKNSAKNSLTWRLSETLYNRTSTYNKIGIISTCFSQKHVNLFLCFSGPAHQKTLQTFSGHTESTYCFSIREQKQNVLTIENCPFNNHSCRHFLPIQHQYYSITQGLRSIQQ